MESHTNQLETLIAKAEEESQFRARLLANSALAETFGIEIQDNFNVVVHEDDSRTAYLVLPASAELIDRHLQQAIRGWDRDGR